MTIPKIENQKNSKDWKLRATDTDEGVKRARAIIPMTDPRKDPVVGDSDCFSRFPLSWPGDIRRPSWRRSPECRGCSGGSALRLPP
jgi:hypothetical protein